MFIYKFNFLFAMFLVLHVSCFAQKIKVAEASESPEGVVRTGLYTDIELDVKFVEKAWERHLKTYGKVLYTKGFYTISSALIYDVSAKPVTVYSQIKSTVQGTHVWWALDLGDSYASSASNNSAYKKAEKILHDFAVDCYKEDINAQVRDAEKAVIAAERNRDREIKRGEQLQKNIEKNKIEKAKLEDLLTKNSEDLEQLKRDVEGNKKDQEEAVKEIEKMKKSVDLVKQKINLIQ